MLFDTTLLIQQMGFESPLSAGYYSDRRKLTAERRWGLVLTSLRRFAQVIPQNGGVIRALMELEKVRGNTEARMIPFCILGRQKWVGEGWLRGSGEESVSPVHPAEDMAKVRQVRERTEATGQTSGRERSVPAVSVGHWK